MADVDCSPAAFIRTVLSGTATCAADQDTTYTAGDGLVLGGTTFMLMQSCGTNQVLKWNGANWACANDIDTDTTYTAGTGLELSSGEFRVMTSCASGDMLWWTGSAWACGQYTAGSGINIAGATISNTGDLDGTDDVTATTPASGDISGTFGNLQIGAGTIGNAELQPASVMAGNIGEPCASGQVLKVGVSGWACSADLDTAYTAGEGLQLVANQFKVVAATDTALGGVKAFQCDEGEAATSLGLAGTFACTVERSWRWHTVPRQNSFVGADTTGTVGQYVSATVGADGFPIIAYYDVSNADLRVAKCADLLCEARTLTTIDSAGNLGQHVGIAIGADGLPVVSYYDVTNADLKVAKCGDMACAAGNTLATLDSAGDVGQYSSVTIGADGLPFITYFDATGGDLKSAKCTTAACTGASTIVAQDTNGVTGKYTSVALGADGFPMIAYYQELSGDLRLVDCGNDACSAGNSVRVLDSTNVVGLYTSIVVPPDGLPAIAYHDATTFDLKYLKCGAPSCNSGAAPNTVVALDQAGNSGQYASVTVTDEGLPVVAFYRTTSADLDIVRCTVATCGGAAGTNLVRTIDSAGTVGQYASIALGPDGLPFIAYHDVTNGDLKVVHLANAFGVNNWSRRG